MKEKKKKNNNKESGISKIYADILEKGRFAGLILLFITYMIYIFNIAKSYIPIDQLENLWGLGIDEFLEQANLSTGWTWIHMLTFSDFMNFAGIAILAGITIVCYLFIIPKLCKKKDYIYLGIAVLQVIVLVTAASGILITGH